MCFVRAEPGARNCLSSLFLNVCYITDSLQMLFFFFLFPVYTREDSHSTVSEFIFFIFFLKTYLFERAGGRGCRGRERES